MMNDFENKELGGEEASGAPAAQPENNHPETEPTPQPQAIPQPAVPAQPAPEAVPPQAPSAGNVSAPAPAEEHKPEAASSAASKVPHLTLEPDPAPPEDPTPEPHIPGSAAEPFHMPEPPRAPEPPPEPTYQQTPPNYGAPQYNNAPPQYGNQGYGAPQYQEPNYGQAPQQSYYQPQYNTPPMGYLQKSRIAAGLLALMFGFLGVHNYYLGFNTKATVQLIVSLAGGLLTCGVATVAMIIWGFIEGILLLSGNPSRLYDGNGVILRD